MKIRTGRAGALLGAALLAALVLGCAVPLGKPKPVPLEATPGQERTPKYEAGGFIVARASIHNHTTFSDGSRTPEDLLELAREQGLAILAYTDHREGKICAGKSVCVQAGGVEKVGYAAYYEHLRRLQAQAADQGMIALKGVEVSPPYFFNTGKFPALVINGQFAHFTVYAIEDPEILAQMPARREFRLKPEPFPGDAPYQAFVDYIVDHGGIVHAVHVESGQDDWIGPVHILTPPPIYDLHLRNLTGFSVLPEAWHEKTAGPGGLWDTALVEYLAGLRPKPLWASADADYHGPGGSLANATTLFYLREFTEPEVYAAMREGRMVALQGEAFQDTYVAEWWVSDSGSPDHPIMLGQEVVVQGTPTVRFALDHPVAGCRTRLIRNGRVVQEGEGTEFTFPDPEQGRSREPAFYRVEVVGLRSDAVAWEAPTMPESELFVNPIFVRFTP